MKFTLWTSQIEFQTQKKIHTMKWTRELSGKFPVENWTESWASELFQNNSWLKIMNFNGNLIELTEIVRLIALL